MPSSIMNHSPHQRPLAPPPPPLPPPPPPPPPPEKPPLEKPRDSERSRRPVFQPLPVSSKRFGKYAPARRAGLEPRRMLTATVAKKNSGMAMKGRIALKSNALSLRGLPLLLDRLT